MRQRLATEQHLRTIYNFLAHSKVGNALPDLNGLVRLAVDDAQVIARLTEAQVIWKKVLETIAPRMMGATVYDRLLEASNESLKDLQKQFDEGEPSDLQKENIPLDIQRAQTGQLALMACRQIHQHLVSRAGDRALSDSEQFIMAQLSPLMGVSGN